MRIPRWPLAVWLVGSHALVFVLPVVVFLASGSLTADLQRQTRDDLQHQGALLAVLVREELADARRTDPELGLADLALHDLLVEAKGTTRSGIQLVDAGGIVVATSGTVLGEDQSGDPLVHEALAGAFGTAIRPRPAQSRLQPPWTESRRANVRVFVAVPVEVGDDVVGAVVLSRTPREEVQAMWHMGPGVVGTLLAALLATAGIAGFSAWVATRSLVALQRGAHRVAEGDFDGVSELDRPRKSHLVEVADTAGAVAAMTERLRERLEYIGEFAANVAHEFKTPIATLRGTVELLQDDDGRMSVDQRATFLGNATRELARLETVVSGLLALARADVARSRERFRLQELLTEVAAARGLPVTGLAGWVAADRSQLETVLHNLIDNALRHGRAADGTPPGVALEAFVGTEATGFRVVDDGRGISEANLARVFDRFFTTDRVTGTGLGLALVRTVAERHGGRVAAASEPGRTAFTVTLPAVL